MVNCCGPGDAWRRWRASAPGCRSRRRAAPSARPRRGRRPCRSARPSSGWNWCTHEELLRQPGRGGQVVEPARDAVDLLGATEPIAWPGTWSGPIRHSGSRASPTQGSCSAHSQRLATVGKSERPGWRSSTSRASLRWAASMYSWTRLCSSRGCSRRRHRGCRSATVDDQLVDRLDGSRLRVNGWPPASSARAWCPGRSRRARRARPWRRCRSRRRGSGRDRRPCVAATGQARPRWTNDARRAWPGDRRAGGAGRGGRRAGGSPVRRRPCATAVPGGRQRREQQGAGGQHAAHQRRANRRANSRPDDAVPTSHAPNR